MLVRFSAPIKAAFAALLIASVIVKAGSCAPKTETAQLRAYGTVSAEFSKNRALFRCQDASHAGILQGKLLADLFWDSGNYASSKMVTLYARKAVVHIWPGYGALLVAQAGPSVLALGADSERALLSAAQHEALLKLPGVRYVPAAAYPRYLDFYDLRAFQSYVFHPSLNGLGKETHWPFLEKFGLGGIVAQTPLFHFNNPAPNVFDWADADYQVFDAERHGGGVTVGISAGGSAPQWWTNKYPEDQMQPSVTSLIGSIASAGGPYESWWSPRADREQGGLAFERAMMDRYKTSPSLDGWHLYAGIHGLEAGFYVPSDDQFMDYSPAGQDGFRQWLRKDKGYTLTTLGKRWKNDSGFYKTWSQVTIPDINGFFGRFGTNSFALRSGWSWKLDGTEGDGSPPPASASGWIPVEMPPSQQLDTLPWKPAFYRTAFNPDAWLQQASKKSVYLICGLGVSPSDEAFVWLNGELLGRFKSAHSDAGQFSIDITRKLQSGMNTLELHIMGAGKPRSPIFLTHSAPNFYPYLGKQANAQWIDVKEWQPQGVYASHLSLLKTARQIDPDRPLILSSGDIQNTGDLMPRLARIYGAGIENTSREAWYFPWWSGLGYVDGFYSASEPSGTPQGISLDRMLSWMMFDGDSHHALFFDLEHFMQREKEDGWFSQNQRYIQLFGKSLREKPSICLLRSVKTSRLGDSTPYSWDVGRGEIQAAHYDNVYATEEDVEEGRIQKYPVLFDTGSVVMDARTLAAIRKYVEAGGTFVALHNTGCQTSEKPDSYPISSLTGFQVLSTHSAGSITFGQVLPLFKNWQGRIFPGEGSARDWKGEDTARNHGLALKAIVPEARSLATWPDGTTAVGYRRLGKGRIVVLGSTFWRFGKDTSGIWESGSDAEPRFFEELFAGLGVQRNAASASAKIWTRKYITKNGLQDWLIAYNDSDIVTTASVSVYTGHRPAQMWDMATSQPVGFTYTADGWTHITDVTFPQQGLRVFGTRRSSLIGGVPFWWQEKTKYWKAVTVPKLAAAPTQPRETIPLNTWRFFADRDNLVGRNKAWQVPKFDDRSWKTTTRSPWSFAEPALKDYHGIGLYRARFTIPKTWGSRHPILGLYNFNTPLAYDHAEFAVNGVPIASYQAHGGEILTYPIASALLSGENVVTVQVTGGKEFSGLSGAIWIGTEVKMTSSLDLSGDWQAVGGDDLTISSVRLPGVSHAGHLARSFAVPASWHGKSVYLHLETGANNWLACVFINGHPITYTQWMHRYGNRPEINMTSYLKPGQINRIELWANTPLTQQETPSNSASEDLDLRAAVLGCIDDLNLRGKHS